MKSLRTYIITVAALLIIYLVAQYNRPNAVDWSETYKSTDKIPFGTYIIYNRIKDIFPAAKVETFHEPIYNVINDHGISHGTYLIICNEITLNEYDYQKLIKFIKTGNDVFISAAYFGDELKKELHIQTSVQMQYIKYAAGIKFINKWLDTNKVYSVGKGIGGIYFSDMDTAKTVALGTDNYHHVNFLKYPAGKGNLYLNANPLMFTNYSLLNKQSTAYASTALSFVKNDSYIMWDQYYAAGREDDESSMRVFLRHAALRWAFYIAFFSLIFYVLYDIKRRQRIIPVIEPLENSTLSFVNVVGKVYYEQRDNHNISSKKILYFLEYLRTEHQLKTNPLDEQFIDSFSQKTGIDNSLAKELVDYINFINAQTKVTDKELIELNKLIEQFYIQSR
jgi:hypothetical protein